MAPRVRQGTAVIAAAVVLVYVSVAGLTEVGDFAIWQANLGWLALAAFVCGFLLSLMGEGSAWLPVASSVVAVLIFCALWNYVFWSFLGEFASMFELAISNPFLYLVLPRSAALLFVTSLAGLLGSVAATLMVPDRYRT